MPDERRRTRGHDLNLESMGIQPPYSMQAEQSVLGAVLLKPDVLTDLVEIVRPEMFYASQNGRIYAEMVRLFTGDQTIDFVTLLDAVVSDNIFPSPDEAKVYLTGLAETVPSISNVKALCRDRPGKVPDPPADGGSPPAFWRTPATSRTPPCCWKTPSSASMRSAQGGTPAP